jgi:hypothetical protein
LFEISYKDGNSPSFVPPFAWDNSIENLLPGYKWREQVSGTAQTG